MRFTKKQIKEAARIYAAGILIGVDSVGSDHESWPDIIDEVEKIGRSILRNRPHLNCTDEIIKHITTKYT